MSSENQDGRPEEKMSDTVIRMYVFEEGRYVYLEEFYGLDELGGTIPGVGDTIVSSVIDGDSDRPEPENQPVYVVVSRYFLPHLDAEYKFIPVIVKERAMTESEAEMYREVQGEN